MSVLLQISDPHFGTEQAPVAAALLELAGQLQPDVALFSGDITQRARRAQWRGAETFAKRLPAKQVLAIPGNHDIPLFNVFARAFAPYAGYASAFGRALEPELDLPDMLVLCLNTTRPRRHKDGEVSTVRYEQVNAMLLNEFLKEHNKVEQLQNTVAQQQKGMEVLTAQLKEQAAQIQKVSAQLEVQKTAPQVVANKP